uniref:Putative polysaccharide lyase family 14 protein n=1 Tax=Moniliophthora roreri TaxID=221103 RepID=A0A0W0G732_MONRR
MQAPFGPQLFEADDPTNSNESEFESVLQVFYPEGSVNPANSPRGDAQFYASPIDITSANNVTFAYSVLFPNGSNFVRGGKLPGLYGGRAGCSGGDAATTCFSTRMMWRKDGQGELYLYAPKDKQTADLCNDFHSVCDAAYGLSVGRGSFSYTPGKWTRISQTVTLNTPGEQDGCFTLYVNGERVIDRKDIFYRDEVSYDSESMNKKSQGVMRKTRETTPKSYSAAPHHPEGGLLGLDGVLRLDEPSLDEFFIQDDGEAIGIQETSDLGPIGFIGMFFSTFFGGHEPEWASPRDQYVWFKDFSILYNA